MGFDKYRVVLYRNQPEVWVAEIPAIPGRRVLMSRADEALEELAEVFRMNEAEYLEAGKDLPRDHTEIVHVESPGGRNAPGGGEAGVPVRREVRRRKAHSRS